MASAYFILRLACIPTMIMNSQMYWRLCIVHDNSFFFRFAQDIIHKNQMCLQTYCKLTIHNFFCYFFPKMLRVISRTVENRKKNMRSMVRQIFTVCTVLSVVHSNREEYSDGTLRNNTCVEIITGSFQKIHNTFHNINLCRSRTRTVSQYADMLKSFDGAGRCMYCLIPLRYWWRKQNISKYCRTPSLRPRTRS